MLKSNNSRLVLEGSGQVVLPTPTEVPHYAGPIQGSKNMARGKCPSCKHILSELIIDAHIAGKVHASKTLRCINFLCPNCNTVVGSQMDPVPVKTETVDLLMQKLRYAS